MLVVGIIIAVLAVLMIIFPSVFMKLKSPRIPEKLLKIPKMEIVFRIWGVICLIIGVTLIVISLV